MRELQQITKEILNKGKLVPGNNLVLVRVKSNEGRKTKAGIIVGFNNEVQYVEGSGSHMADMAEVHGTVVQVPEWLYYQVGDSSSMTWKTRMQLEVGDEVWFNFIASTHANGFEVEDSMYLFIPYGDCLVAKRGEAVIPLNGYVLLSEVKKEEVSFLYLADVDKIDTHRGIVRYVGEPNMEYRVDAFSDDIDIAEGDLVQLKGGFTPFRLERQSYFNDFGDMLIVVQRRNIDLNYGKHKEV
jgi:co-chaperonin GroES (HSP10)